jgi:1,2-diacylglycerol 3-alpha-glucosyltransferase
MYLGLWRPRTHADKVVGTFPARMRIAVFSESYDPIINGVSVCVTALRTELERLGHEVFVFAPGFKGHTDDCSTVIRVPSVHTLLMPNYPFPLPLATSAHRIFDSLHVDVVHTQTPFILGILGMRWAARLGIPVISTNHTMYTEYSHYAPIRPRALTRYLLTQLMCYYYNRCAAVVTPSLPIKANLEQMGVRTPIRVIKTGVREATPVDLETRLRVRTEMGVSEDEQMLLYVGRIAREKNLTALLRAFRIVADRNKLVRLALVGGGPALDEVQTEARRLGLDGLVKFCGPVPHAQLGATFAAADVFFFPSTTETQGLAVCEAMSAGTPVVAANAGGIPENVRDGVDGFLCPNDPQVFAERILRLVDNPGLRTSMGEAARDGAASFSLDKMAGEFEDLYASVLSSGQTSK